MKNLMFGLCLLMLSSCVQRAFYQSPSHGNMHAYKAMPLKKDSHGPAVYGDFFLSGGWANHNLNDDNLAAAGGLHVAHSFGNFQAYYGGSASLGRYDVKSFYPQYDNIFWYTNGNLNDSLINSMSGPKSYGTAGLFGGINLVQPFKGGEWRYLGAEFSWQNEWGNYYRFRNTLPKDAANIIDYNQNYCTLTLTTDIIGEISKDLTFGYKAGLGFSTRRLDHYHTEIDYTKSRPFTMSQTVHFGFNKATLYLQATTGHYMLNTQLGLNYRFN